MPNICHEILIGASANKIYDAITGHEGLSAWWTPGVMAVPKINSVARFPFGPDYSKEMKIIDLVPSQLVKWSCIAGAEEWIGTNISFALEDDEKQMLLNRHPELSDQIRQQKSNTVTLVIFHHNNWGEYSPMFAECSYTWGRFLRSLKLFCETGRGRPWPNQHTIEA